jgi:predicted ATPase
MARQAIGFGEIRPVEVSDLVARLASKSLVLAGAGAGQGRHRLPSLARIYAGIKLDESGERDELAQRHAERCGLARADIGNRVDLATPGNCAVSRHTETEQGLALERSELADDSPKPHVSMNGRVHVLRDQFKM